MNIKDVETLTGITKQNIRFYEKKGLLTPDRNQENSYREYSDADVERLKRIKILRRIDVPIEQIRRILEGEDHRGILKAHLSFLTEKKSDLDAAIRMCRFLLDQKTADIHTQAALSKMGELERKGGHFMNILNDYKKISKTESKKEFSFMPDTLTLNQEEFTEALCKYGMENNLNLVVTKHGMYPKFEIDGIEYEAWREFGRFGAVIICKMTHPELLENEYLDVDVKRRRILRNIHWAVTHLSIPVILFLYWVASSKSLLLAAWLLLPSLALFRFYYRNFRLK